MDLLSGQTAEQDGIWQHAFDVQDTPMSGRTVQSQPHEMTRTAELERAALQLEEAHRRTEALVVYSRRVAHDLSNFLTVIRTYSELLLSDLPSDHPTRADVTEIAQAADTTVSYVQRVSSFGRAHSAKQGPLSVAALVRDIVEQALHAGLGPITLVDPVDTTVKGSAPVLGEALHEVIVNAREASPTGATIEVSTHVLQLEDTVVDAGVPINAGSWAVIEVRDSGAGVPEAVAANMFDPFVTSKSGVRGAGFGLATARCAAWAFGGELTLGRDGAHTRARFYLPVLSD